VGSHCGVAVLAATTTVVVVVVPILVVVVSITVAGAATVILARRARRRQWSGRHFVGVERRRSSSWTGGVQVDFLHHGICLDVEVGDDGVDVRQRSGRDLRGRGTRGSGDLLLGRGLSFEIGGGLLLIKERMGGQDAAAAFSSSASVAATRASSRCLRTSALAAGRAMMSDGMRTKGEDVEAIRASSRCLRVSALMAGRATMSDDMTTGGERVNSSGSGTIAAAALCRRYCSSTTL
jgi:hypothetical protein